MNTLFDYIYRDGSNYKQHGSYVAEGTLTEKETEELWKCLSDGEYFIPEQVGIPAVRFEDANEDDHCWHELQDVTRTGRKADGKKSVHEILDAFRSARGNWDDVTYGII